MLKHTFNQVPSLRDCPYFIGQLDNPATCITYPNYSTMRNIMSYYFQIDFMG